MNNAPSSTDRFLSLYLTLAQYPILGGRIRARMRRELFDRSVMTAQAFEARAREMAIRSQEQEGLLNPYSEEASDVWELRLARVRDHLTDLIFSRHLSFQIFERIVNEVLSERGMSVQELMLSLNPELAPTEMVFEHAIAIERMDADERIRYQARLQESKVVLIRTMISDQLRYINIAKEWFTLQDLSDIRRRKIGAGRIGGKAAGMLLAARVLNEVANEQLKACLHIPDSYFIGSGEMYTYMSINNLVHWSDQKYKNEEQMRADYPQIVEDFLAGEFPPETLEQFQNLLAHVGKSPLIVRSSSLLEDNFGTSFAGKYDSIFVPNQGNDQENLKALAEAVVRVYASTLNPTALLYRRSKGLLDYDERMAILIQVVEGERFGRYFMPHAAGVAFSRNLYRWTPQIRREDGFIRLVWGLGTRAVDRVGNDYPRLVALSHPLLRPSNDPKAVRRYSQQYVDLIDLQDNLFRTLPIHEVLNGHYAPLRYIAQMEDEGAFMPIRSSAVQGDISRLTLTFDELMRRTPFAEMMRQVLSLLESNYRSPVDLEFTLHLEERGSSQPNLRIDILQCRPQSHLVDTEQAAIPADLPREDTVFSTRFVVPRGRIDRVDSVVFVPPEGYYALQTPTARNTLRRAIGRLNAALDGEAFICVGPGRWGSSNPDLGVSIDYGDIYHTLALVELAGQGIGPAPEPSLGTHFFQDLLESQIYPLAVVLDDPTTVFNRSFFYETPNRVLEKIEVEEEMLNCLRLVRVSDFRAGYHIRLVMNDEKSLAVAYLEAD